MNKAKVVLVTVILLSSPIMAGSTVTAQSTPPTDLDQDNVFEGTDTINVWQESVRFFRVDTGNAAQRVQNPSINLELEGSQDGLGKNFIAAFDPNTPISINYPATDNVNTDLADENVQVVAARAEPTNVDDANYPNTFSDAVDSLTSDNANENASYYFVNEGDTLSSSQQNTYTFDDPPEPGHYTFFIAATDGNSPINIDNNQNISVTDDITIIGGDSATIQEGSATVTKTPANPTPGDTINFDVDASGPLSDTGVTHAIAVYKKDTLEDSFHVISVNDKPDKLSDIDIQEDTEFRHSIVDLNGTADVEEGASVNGLDLSDGRVSRAVGAGAIIDFIGEELNREGQVPPTRTTSGADTVLNASMDADVNEVGDYDELDIETKESWEPGTYQFVYMSALENDKSAMSTQTGTFQLGVSGGVSNDGTATVNLPGSSVDSATITLPTGSGATEVTVSTSNNPTGNAPDPGGTVATYVDISADTGVQSDTTITTEIQQSTLDSANVNDPVIAHFVDGSWEELATTSSTSGSVVTLTATASGLSPFAIAQTGSINPGGNNNNNNNNAGDDGDGSSGGGGGVTPGTGTGTGVDVPNISSELGDQATITAESEPLIRSESDTRSTATFLESFPLLRSVSFVKTDGFDEFSGTVNARAIDGEPAATGVPEGTVVSLTNVTMPGRNVSQVELRYEIPNSRVSDLGVSGDELTVRQFDGSDWQEIDVEAEETESSTIITAQLSDTTSSYFALMAPAVEDDTAAGENESEDEEPDSDDAVPGFGIVVSIVSIIAMVIALSRRE